MISHVFKLYNDHLRALIKRDASAYKSGRLRRRDAPPPAKRERPMVLKKSLDGAKEYGQQLVHTSPFKGLVSTVSKRTATSAIDQTAKAVNLPHFNTSLQAQASSFNTRVETSTVDLMEQALDRAVDVLDEWSDLEEGDEDELDEMLRDGLDGIAGKGLAAAAVAFGALFSEMIQAAQRDAGVSEYYWLAQHDSATRPEHLALDNGEAYSWDDPPLSAEDSDNGEDNHPGEDYNCRCVAAPVVPGEE